MADTTANPALNGVRKKTKKANPNHLDFTGYIKKIQSSVSSQNLRCEKTVQVVDTIVNYIGDELAELANRLRISLGNKTIDSDMMLNAFEVLFASFPEFVDGGVNFAKEALKSFQASLEDDRNSADGKKVSKRQESRAGLLIAVSRTEHMIRRSENGGIVMSVSLRKKLAGDSKNKDASSANSVRMGHKAPIGLAALLEFIVRELMIVVCRDSWNSGKKKPVPRDVLLAIDQIPPLRSLVERRNSPLVLLNMGVVPHIDAVFLENSSFKKSRRNKGDETAEEDSKGGLKKVTKPGEKALVKIRKWQRQQPTCLLTEKTPFETGIREMISEAHTGGEKMVHLGRGTVDLIRAFVEDRAIDLCKNAVKIMAESNFKSVRRNDLELVWKLCYPDVVDVQSNISLCKKSRIDRIQYRGGIKRKASIDEFLSTIHRFIYSLTHKIVNILLVHLKSSRVGTLNVGILLDVYHDLGYRVVIVPEKEKQPKKSKEGGEEEDEEAEAD